MLLGGFILLNAILKLSFVSLINANKARLRDMAEDGHRRAGAAFRLSSDATRLLASQQFLDLVLRFTIALVAAVTLAPPLREQLLDWEIGTFATDLIAYGGLLLVVAFITLVFGEMLPTSVAIGYADTLAMWVAGPMTTITVLLAPVVRLVQWISGQIATPLVGRVKAPFVTEEEIKLMVDAGSEGGAIENEEREMIFSIIQFGDTVAREVMVPRIDMVALESHTSLGEALATIIDCGHSRIPVFEESIDHIRGLLYAKDLLVLMRDGKLDVPIKDILRPAYFVPESKKAGDLLTELQHRKIHLAVVVDEYGGTAGLVTIEDLIEEIVGEIRDEYDINEEEVYQKIDENEYIFDAGVDLDDLNRLLDVSLPTDESDTLGGYILSRLGKVPDEGEAIETENLRITVLSVDDRRIRKIRLVRLLSPLELEDIREEPSVSFD